MELLLPLIPKPTTTTATITTAFCDISGIYLYNSTF